MRFFNMLNRIVYSSLRKFKTFLFFANKDEKIGSVYCRQLNFEQNINMMPLYCKVRGYQFCKYPFIQRFLVLGGKLIQNEKSFKEKMCLDIVVSTPKTTNLYFSSFFFCNPVSLGCLFCKNWVSQCTPGCKKVST